MRRFKSKRKKLPIRILTMYNSLPTRILTIMHNSNL